MSSRTKIAFEFPAPAAQFCLGVSCVSAVRVPKRARHAVLLLRHRHPVNMIGHQAKPEQIHTESLGAWWSMGDGAWGTARMFPLTRARNKSPTNPLQRTSKERGPALCRAPPHCYTSFKSQGRPVTILDACHQPFSRYLSVVV